MIGISGSFELVRSAGLAAARSDAGLTALFGIFDEVSATVVRTRHAQNWLSVSLGRKLSDRQATTQGTTLLLPWRNDENLETGIELVKYSTNLEARCVANLINLRAGNAFVCRSLCRSGEVSKRLSSIFSKASPQSGEQSWEKDKRPNKTWTRTSCSYQNHKLQLIPPYMSAPGSTR
ncbi:hypothetical protein VTK56DRAFT_9384 [Thermocarpiscus australiensis]